MKQVTYLSNTRYRRKYNDVVRKKLANAGIKTTEVSTRNGWYVNVRAEDHFEASKIVLSVSLNNPKY
jgi:predicted component of type VI protein secretion system